MILPIFAYGHPVLKTKANKIDKDFKNLLSVYLDSSFFPNLDELDLNPLLVQADPGNNLRYCEDQKINFVPDTLDPVSYTHLTLPTKA